MRCSPGSPPANRCSTCSASGASATSSLAIDRRVLIPRPETELVAGVAIEKAPHRRAATLGRRPRHRVRRDRPVRSRSNCRSTGRPCGSPTPASTHSTWPRANLAGLGRAGRNVRVAHGSWFDALPADVGVRRDRVEPAVRRDRFARRRRVGHRLGAARRAVRRRRRPRRHPAARRRSARATCGDGGWLVLEIGSKQGPAVAALLHEPAASSTSRSARTSPVTTASPSAAGPS